MCVCINRKQAALWSLGDNQHSQKAKQEERAMPHLITSMEELTLNPTHINTNPNGNLSRSQSSDQLHEVGHTHTEQAHWRSFVYVTWNCPYPQTSAFIIKTHYVIFIKKKSCFFFVFLITLQYFKEVNFLWGNSTNSQNIAQLNIESWPAFI